MYIYNTQNIVARIETACNTRRGTRKIAELLRECNLPTSTIDNIKRGSAPAVDKIAIIADALSCSVDYLLGRTDQMKVNHGSDTSVSIGSNNTAETNINISLSKDDADILKLIHRLDLIERSKLICELSDKVNVDN